LIQTIIKKGRVFAEDVPAPLVSDGALLIKVVNSCISAGTEVSGVQGSGQSVIKRALAQPNNVKKVIDIIRSDGIARAYETVRGKLETGSATGYSISGVVIDVGKGVRGFNVGDHVAAAGGGYAYHAEYVDVPENLVVKLPLDMDLKAASTVALGGIAMQGVRRADLHLGEFAVVVGAGVLGLLTVQMLRLSGIRVAAIDLDENRLQIAFEMGAELVLNPVSANIISMVQNWAGNYGADAVIFTAATSNSEPLSQSFQMCKRKGRIVLVGVSGMEIKREDIYQKELDFFISTSYGPGRYDKNYEEKGLDYPYAYIRWTEKRNMAEYLRLVHHGAVRLDKLISAVYPAKQVSEAFESLQQPINKPLMVLLDYGSIKHEKVEDYAQHERKVSISKSPIHQGIINIALVGAGSFATNVHLPNIAKLSKKYRLHCVVNRTGLKAKTIAQQYKANYATADYKDVLKDKEVDLVLIATRHGSHAELAIEALNAGKHVFVEKPLATALEGLDAIKTFYADAAETKPILFIGFNRRFSSYAKEIKKHTDNRINPLLIHYRMNAGYIPPDHWAYEDGGRIIGEACHIIDLMSFLTGSQIKTISVDNLVPTNEKFSASDNKVITLAYLDGSVATIHYFAVGSKECPKEYMEVHFDEKTIILDDYRSLKGFGMALNEISTSNSQKGHLEELEVLYTALSLQDKRWPISLESMCETTQVTFAIARL